MPVTSYKVPEINYKGRRKSLAIPDQSLSIQEIVKRYVRGIPVDVVKRQGVFLDQSEHDLEALSRLDFGEKAEYAQVLKAQADSIEAEHTEAVRRVREERAQEAKQKSEEARAQAEAKKSPAQGPA